MRVLSIFKRMSRPIQCMYVVVTEIIYELPLSYMRYFPYILPNSPFKRLYNKVISSVAKSVAFRLPPFFESWPKVSTNNEWTTVFLKRSFCNHRIVSTYCCALTQLFIIPTGSKRHTSRKTGSLQWLSRVIFVCGTTPHVSTRCSNEAFFWASFRPFERRTVWVTPQNVGNI